MPDTNLGSKSTAVNKKYKDPCPPRVYFLARETRQTGKSWPNIWSLLQVGCEDSDEAL